MQPSPAVESESDAECDLPAYRIVLTEGRFIAADGFTISVDGRTVTPVDQTPAPGTPWRISLTWTVPPQSAVR